MIFLCIGLVFFTLFVIMVSADPRRFVNAVLLLFSIGFLFLGLVIASSAIPFLNYVIIILTLCIPLGLLFLIVLLFHNSVIMIKKEGKRVKNLLPAFFGLFLVLSIIFPFMTLSGVFEKTYITRMLAWLAIMLSFYFWFSFFALITYSQVYLILPKKLEQDYIIVLGCGLLGGQRVSPLLRGRIDKALEVYEKTGHRSKIVLSGGKGGNERISEASAMASYLDEKGYKENEDYILEDKSRNTYENLKNTRDMLDTPDHTKKFLIVTSNFHVFRSLLYSRKLKIKASGVGCNTARYYWPTAFIREYIAILKYYKKAIIVIFILWLLFAAAQFNQY